MKKVHRSLAAVLLFSAMTASTFGGQMGTPEPTPDPSAATADGQMGTPGPTDTTDYAEIIIASVVASVYQTLP